MVTLRSGEPMTIKVVECPAGEYAERLTIFLEHKGDVTFRDMKRRLRGDYAEHTLDRFFTGELEGRIISQMGYMLARDTLDVGVFGHVYTEPEHRGKGAASALMEACMNDFNAGPGQALFCGTGSPSAQRMYARHGFLPLYPERGPLGPQGYIKPTLAADFGELQRLFFAPGHPTHIRMAHMGDRAKVDKVLDQSEAVTAMSASWHRVFLAAAYPDFVRIYQAVEDGKGIFAVLETDERHVVGYAFALAAGSQAEAHSKVLDFLVHPSYYDETPALIRWVTKQAMAAGAGSVRCYLPACDEAKVQAAQEAGFMVEHTFKDYCAIGDEPVDLIVLVRPNDQAGQPAHRSFSEGGESGLSLRRAARPVEAATVPAR